MLILNFEQLLVNQGGMNAQFKGSGFINGMPDSIGSEFNPVVLICVQD